MSARIEDLEPVTRGLCEKFLVVCNAMGVNVRVTHTLRTMDEQAHLYAKGRSLPGEKVTNAPPGSSPHNYGLAFDICFDGDAPYPDPRTAGGLAKWGEVGAIGQGAGLAWGGNWKSFKDRPHFERPRWKEHKA